MRTTSLLVRTEARCLHCGETCIWPPSDRDPLLWARRHVEDIPGHQVELAGISLVEALSVKGSA